MRHLRRLGSIALTGLLVLTVALFALVALGPHLFGYRTMTMLTGSMEPMIAPGDVVVAVEKPAEQLAVGDVISYHIPVQDNRVETHRVTEVDTDKAGKVTFRTKGDANQAVDPWTATLESDTVWETVFVVPHVGGIIRTVRASAAQEYVMWGALAALVGVGLTMIWRREEPEGEDVAIATAVGAAADGRIDTSALPALDIAALVQLGQEVEDAAFAAAFAGRFQDLLPQRVDRIEQALRTADASRALDAALSLKVASATVGAMELQRVAETIEGQVRRGETTTALDSSVELEQAADRAGAALGSYLDAA